MPINSRQKGAAAERDVANILKDHLGIEVKRNLDQWRSGGYDLVGVEGFAIEVKIAKTPLINQWWEQAKTQAADAGLIPALFWRVDRKPWRVVVPLYALNNTLTLADCWKWTAEISPEAFCMLARENVCSGLT